MEVGGNKSVACSKTDAKGGGANIPGKKSGELCRDADKNEVRMDVTTAGASASAVSNVGFSGWHHSSRIIRVPRTSAGKDRHSKVLTYRGLRDRRIRLSVTTAIQFYDLLDRLGYDQPSKAVEWLIKAAEAPIANLPSLPSVEESIFATAEQSVAEQKQPVEETADVEDDDVKTALQKYDRNNPDHRRRHLPVSSSGYSSTSETSKGSELSLSRLEVRAHRMKARERARERAVKEKEREKERKFPTVVRRQDLNPNSTPPHHGSFTDLLTGAGTRRIRCPISNSSAYTMHQAKHWPSPPTDYFNFSHTAPSSSSSRPQYGTPGHGYFTQQIQIGSFSPQPQTFPVAAFGTAGVHQNSVVQEHLLPPASEYDRIRGTLQSNSPSFLLPQHVQRFSTAEESAMSYVLGSPPSPPGAHSILPISDGRLQLFYGDGSYRHTNPKDKESN